MKVLFLSSEVAPWSKSGGLGDVARALPVAMADLGHDVRVLTPAYGSVSRDGLRPEGSPLRLRLPRGEWEFQFLSTREQPNFCTTFVDQPELFARHGIYGERHHDYSDNPLRFAAYAMASLTFAQQLEFIPDIVHLNDWQTGLAAVALKRAYRRAFPKTRSVFTIHNLAYQGNFPRAEMETLGLPWTLFGVDGVEFHGQLSFMKAGLQFADAITTVSPSYAREIQTREGGMGFEGVLHQRVASLHGILNGVDTREWNPATDALLPAQYTASDLAGRATCRTTLLERSQLDPPAPGMPIFGIVGRMVEQKGVDLMQGALPSLLEHGARAVVLGTGSHPFEESWQQLVKRFPRALAVTLGFDNGLAHLIEAGSDFFVMPSRFEPCGLNQMYSLLYGAVPVVRSIGGLADTVSDATNVGGTGIVFREATVEGLRRGLQRAVALFGEPEHYARVRMNGMTRDLSWTVAAGRYEALYRSLLLPAQGTLR
jgi:starch synthase